MGTRTSRWSSLSEGVGIVVDEDHVISPAGQSRSSTRAWPDRLDVSGPQVRQIIVRAVGERLRHAQAGIGR